jgi:hypothetical protein
VRDLASLAWVHNKPRRDADAAARQTITTSLMQELEEVKMEVIPVRILVMCMLHALYFEPFKWVLVKPSVIYFSTESFHN